MRALVAHSGGPTTVINASLAGLVHEARKHVAVGTLLGARHGIDGMMRGDFLDLLGQPTALLDAVAHAPSSALGTSRRAVTDDDLARVLSVLEDRGVEILFYNGGNGSMGTAGRMARLARETGRRLAVIGIPKTIDNDIAETDHSPGYGSAARYFACAARDLGADNRALPGLVQVLEVLGRNTGWIAAATTLARGEEDDAPHLVYVPERPLARSRFLDDVRRVFDRLGRCLVVVCEGQLDEDGQPFGADVRLSSRGPLATNLGHRLASLITEELRLKARAEKPGLLGRASAALRSDSDWHDAWLCGAAAVRAALGGHSNVMVTLEREPGPDYRPRTGLVALDAVADVQRFLPRAWLSEDGGQVSRELVDYVAPLTGPIDRLAALR